VRHAADHAELNEIRRARAAREATEVRAGIARKVLREDRIDAVGVCIDIRVGACRKVLVSAIRDRRRREAMHVARDREECVDTEALFHVKEATGAPFDNRFVSIITIENKKIVHWRDYMDSLAAWTALNPRRSVVS
jgi:hypothetical protein